MSRASLDKEPQLVAAMFDDVAPKYDRANFLLSFGQERVWRRRARAALRLQPGERVLDLAAGTGASTAALAVSGAEVIACDFSPGMLAAGKARHPELTFVQGDAMDLPFADNYFDAVTISYGLRNVADSNQVLREMFRVTKPGGRVIIAEFSQPTCGLFRALYRFYLRRLLPLWARLVTSNASAYGYLMESILDWPAQEELGQQLLAAGWRNVAYRNLTGGIVALHRGEKLGNS